MNGDQLLVHEPDTVPVAKALELPPPCSVDGDTDREPGSEDSRDELADAALECEAESEPPPMPLNNRNAQGTLLEPRAFELMQNALPPPPSPSAAVALAIARSRALGPAAGRGTNDDEEDDDDDEEEEDAVLPFSDEAPRFVFLQNGEMAMSPPPPCGRLSAAALMRVRVPGDSAALRNDASLSGLISVPTPRLSLAAAGRGAWCGEPPVWKPEAMRRAATMSSMPSSSSLSSVPCLVTATLLPPLPKAAGRHGLIAFSLLWLLRAPRVGVVAADGADDGRFGGSVAELVERADTSDDEDEDGWGMFRVLEDTDDRWRAATSADRAAETDARFCVAIAAVDTYVEDEGAALERADDDDEAVLEADMAVSEPGRASTASAAELWRAAADGRDGGGGPLKNMRINRSSDVRSSGRAFEMSSSS